MNKSQKYWNADSEHQILIRKQESQSWLQDVVTIAFDKKYFDERNVLEKIKKIKDFSEERTIWKNELKEEEPVFFISKERDSILLDNETEFKKFVSDNIYNPSFTNKFIVFVNGKFSGVDENRTKLIQKIYDEHGNIEIYVGKVTLNQEIKIIDSPEKI